MGTKSIAEVLGILEQKYWVWALRVELYGAEILDMGTKSGAEVLGMGTKIGAVRSRSTGYGH